MSDQSENDTRVIKLAIDKKYSQVASSSSSSCCCGSNSPGIPSDALSVSLGCGSPVDYVTFQDGMTLADLGCGGGIDVFAAANKLAPMKGKIIGIDSTAKMIARARRTASQYNYTNVEFRLGEMENLPLERESVDVVTSNCVINLVPDKTRAFNEIFRVLKPGGSMTVSDIVAKNPLPERVRKDPQKWSECISGALSIDEIRKALGHAGFVGFELLKETRWDSHDDKDLELSSITFHAIKPGRVR